MRPHGLVAPTALLLMVLPVLSGCLGAGPLPAGTTGGDPLADAPAPDPLVSYLSDLSEPDASITVEGSILEQHRVPAPDGTLLDAWVVRPDVEGPVPVVLQVTPYYAGGTPMPPTMEGHRLGYMADLLVPRGYAYGIVSVRGTGNSEGCFTQGGPTEATDTAAVVEHFGDAEWSNGNVGLIGASYPGTTPKDVWVEAPPSLKTIVPVAGISDMYKYNFVEGVPINIQGFGFNTYYWVLVGALPFGSSQYALLDPTSAATAVAGEACEDQVWVQEGGVSSTVDGNKDDYWQVRDFLAELDASPDKDRASVFLVHGLQDWNVKPHNLDGWIEAVQATGVPFKAFLGQWAHAYPQSSGGDCESDGYPCRNDWWGEALIAWFDRFLKERETGILDAPAVQVMDDDGRWRHETAWPPADAEPWVLHPDGDGTLGEAPGAGEAMYHDHQGGLTDSVGPLDAPDLLGPDRVVWRSEPLAEDVHVSGVPVFEANVTASGARASLMLTLAEETEGPPVRLRPFNFAAQSLNHVESLEEGTMDVSGQTLHVKARFFPQDDVVHAGSRLVLIAAGNLVTEGEPGPDLQPVSDGSEITVALDGARLVLPVDAGLVFEEPQPFDDA